MVPQPQTAGGRRRGWILAAAVVAVLAIGIGALVVIASGGGDETDAAQYSLGAATEQAAQAHTVTFDMAMTAGGFGEMAMSGAIDNEAQLMTMSMDVGVVMGAGADGGTMEMILDVAGGMMYMNADQFGELFSADAPWISMDLETMAAMSGQSLDDLRSQFAVDPTESVSVLDEANAVEVGMEDIDGESLMHYEVTVDLADALAANPQAQQQFDELEELDGELPESIVYDVWVTADNELRRMVFELPVMGDTMRMQLDMRASDEPLDVTIPSGDEVMDITEMMGG